jgi:hypothetical protein
MERTSGWLDQWMQGFDPVTVTVALPSWAVGVVGAVLVAFCLVAFARAGRRGVGGTLSRLLLVGVVGGAIWAAIDYRARGNLAAEQTALDRRAYELSERALAPGSALACLDAQAGDSVEASCEKALFASPESTAAAVAYVNAQLALLADSNDFAIRYGVNDDVAMAALRHAVELDRFGIVAHVLATRDGCRSSDQCGAFAMLRNITRVSDNLSAGKYEFYVLRHASEWPPVAASSPFAANFVSPPNMVSPPVSLVSPSLASSSALVSPPVVAHAPPAAAAASAPAAVAANPVPPAGTTLARGTPNNKLFFPSSSSIPPVSIMDAEPAPPAQTNTKPPPKKPPAQTAQSRQPANQSNQSNQTAQAPRSTPPRSITPDAAN